VEANRSVRAVSRRFFLIVWSLALFSLCLVLNTRHNDFSWHYHPDEPGKVEQVREARWDFHHPFLLLGTVHLFADRTAPEQSVVEVGRTVSAAFISAAVVALSLLAWRWRGRGAAFVVGLVLATHHQLFELSHYFKEDSALLFGLSCAVFAAWRYAEKPTLLRAALLGASCALAISGKYLGVVSLVFAIPVLVNRRLRRAPLCFALTLVLILVAVNWPMLSSLSVFRDSFARETALVVKGQSGMTRRVPHAQYWSIFRDNTTPMMWALLLVFITSRWRQRRGLTVIEAIVSVFPFAFALALSFSPKTNDRYFLPATAFLSVLAVIGASDLATWLSTRWPRRVVFGIASLALVVAQFPSWSSSRPGWLAYDAAFQHDDTKDLIEWLQTVAPPQAVIAKDNRVPLPDPARKKYAAHLAQVPQKIVTPRGFGVKSDYVADLGTIEELQAKGITHVAVSESDYGKFFLDSLRPQASEEAAFTRRREFYARLPQECDIVFDRDRGTVIYLHPGIRVYRLAPED
jgi:hypothetical protein